MDDREVVALQLGRPPRAFRRVVVRCPFGRPAVTEQEPYDASGDRVVLTAGTAVNMPGSTNVIKVDLA